MLGRRAVGAPDRRRPLPSHTPPEQPPAWRGTTPLPVFTRKRLPTGGLKCHDSWEPRRCPQAGGSEILRGRCRRRTSRSCVERSRRSIRVDLRRSSARGFGPQNSCGIFPRAAFPGIGVYRGHDEVRSFFEDDWFQTFPSDEWEIEVDELIDNGGSGGRHVAPARSWAGPAGRGRNSNRHTSSRCATERWCGP